MLDTLPERIALARRDGLDYADFLQIVLADEVSRRDHGRLELRLRQAGFEQLCRLEDFDWSAQVRLDRRRRRRLLARFLDRRHVLLDGPVGASSTLGYAAVRSGHSVRFVTADQSCAGTGRPLHREGLPQLPRPRPADPRRPRAAPAQRTAVDRPLRADYRAPPQLQLRHHLEPRRRGVARPLRRPDPRQQRPRPARQRQLPDRDRGRELPPAALAAPRPARAAARR